MELTLSVFAPESLPPDFKLEISLDPETAVELSERFETWQALPAVRDDETMAVCLAGAKEIKGFMKALEQSREQLKKPFLAACRSIDGAAQGPRKSLEEIYENVVSAIAIFEGSRRIKRDEEKRQHEAALERLAKEAHREKDEAKRAELLARAQDEGIAANKLAQPIQGMALVKTYRFEIENLDEVWNFNRKLLKVELSQSACMDVVRMLKESGAKELLIPGIRITEIIGARVAGTKSGTHD
jgi:hypothetical protein